jgi:hypothetical protein
LKLLLDEHIWPGVAELVTQHLPTAEIQSIHHYADGGLMNTVDDEILHEAQRCGWTLVTFDVNSIPRLLQEKAIAREDHGGVIFVSSRSFAQNDHGGLAQALVSILQAESATNWTNRIMFLSRKEAPTHHPHP